MSLFDALGFRWDRSAMPTAVPSHSIERACFRYHKMLPTFVWDASSLEGNPLTFPEVKTLLEGVTVGGRKVADQEQILNLADSSRRLLAMVKSGHAAKAQEFNEKMVRFSLSRDATEMMFFLVVCHPEAISPQRTDQCVVESDVQIGS